MVVARDATQRTDGVSPARRVPRPRPPAERRPGFAHLTMEQLRAYRADLADQESRVSYWRRILNGRLDQVRAGGRAGGASGDRLRTALAAAEVDHHRAALLAIVPADGGRTEIPVLPPLLDLWDAEPAPGDTAAAGRLLTGLTAAESTLSTYRAALHARIADATLELIARYRQDPATCVQILPVDPRFAAGGGAPRAPGARG